MKNKELQESYNKKIKDYFSMNPDLKQKAGEACDILNQIIYHMLLQLDIDDVDIVVDYIWKNIFLK